MTRWWTRLQKARFWVRVPVKAGLFAAVVFIVLFPYPRMFWRHVQHLRHLDRLTDPSDPALGPVRQEFDAYLQSAGTQPAESRQLRGEVERFVYHRVPYAWDWDNWGVADYIPTVGEIVAKGREDCDGRAVLAVALLRSYGVQAELAADPRHVWVRTPDGDCMHPLGPPVFEQGPAGMSVRWRGLINVAPLAFGVSVFPLSRELIVLLAAWLLLLPPKIPLGAALVIALLMIEALLLCRAAGMDPVAPRHGTLAWACLHLLVAAWLLVRYRPRNRFESNRR
jgi:hypothetical protein